MACAGQSVTLRLTDDVDVARGDIIAAADRPPRVTREVSATVCHLADRPLHAGDRVLLRHGTATVKALVGSLDSVLDLANTAPRTRPGSPAGQRHRPRAPAHRLAPARSTTTPNTAGPARSCWSTRPTGRR